MSMNVLACFAFYIIAHLHPYVQVKEHHRRDGFEVGNADKIFESTSKDQLTRGAA